VRDILNNPGSHNVLFEKFGIDITRAKLLCLRPSTWLNDEAINFYMCLLMDRDEKRYEQQNNCTKKRKSSHYFNSFFLVKLIMNEKYTYSNVKRWTKKFDVFQKDKIFIPVNINNSHWTMIVVFVQKKEIHYYDSMSGSGMRYLKWILQVRL